MPSHPKSLERDMQSAIFASRRLLAPFFLGLILAVKVFPVKFGKELP